MKSKTPKGETALRWANAVSPDMEVSQFVRCLENRWGKRPRLTYLGEKNCCWWLHQTTLEDKILAAKRDVYKLQTRSSAEFLEAGKEKHHREKRKDRTLVEERTADM